MGGSLLATHLLPAYVVNEEEQVLVERKACGWPIGETAGAALHAGTCGMGCFVTGATTDALAHTLLLFRHSCADCAFPWWSQTRGRGTLQP